jgi:N-methylhydantoinase A
MVRALRRVSLERGHDPRRFCLVAFGGGGPLHACALAAELEIPTVLIPRYPGTLSALGMLLSDIRKEYSRTVMRPASEALDDLDLLFRELEERAVDELRAEGVAPVEIELSRRLDARYRGQSYELDIPAEPLEPSAVSARFDAAHRQRFGYASEGAPCEIVNVRLRAVGHVPQPELPYLEPRDAQAVPAGVTRVYDGGWLDAALYNREELLPGTRLKGPALLLQADTTTWVSGGCFARVDGWYNVLIERG